MSLAHVCRSAYARTTLLALVCALSDSSTESASAMFTAPPPTMPSGSGTPEPSPWIPINDAPSGGVDGCGDWLWLPYRVRMVAPGPTPPTQVPFSPTLSSGNGTRRLGLASGSPTAMIGSYALSNLWIGPLCTACGTTDDAPETRGSAERSGFLCWFPSVSAAGEELASPPTRIRINSTAYLHGRIDLDFGIVLAGETSRLAIGGLNVDVKTSGDPFSSKIDREVADSPASIKVNPNAVHASSAQSSGLSAGVTLGADNGGSGSVSWTLGGSRAWIELNESMECIEWACVMPNGEQKWYFQQDASMLVDAALIYGRHAKVDATVEFENFLFETMGCPSCSSTQATAPGPQASGGTQ